MSDEKLLVLYPARWAYRHPPVEGSTLVTADCGHRAFLAPSSAAFLEGDGHDARTVCVECTDVPKLMANGHVKEFVPGSRSELNDALGVGHTDQLVAWLKERHGFKG